MKDLSLPLEETSSDAWEAISSNTELCGILLHPAAHTRSPAMHNAAFRALGINAVYLAFDVPAAALATAITGARALRIRQLAISIPHKETVIPQLDRVDETAQRIGAVNTVTRQGNLWVGANTDWLGSVRALEQAGPLQGRRAVVLGAGGAACAAVFGLLERGAHVVVLNRSVERARALVKRLGAHEAGPLERLRDLACDIVINTTSVGMGEDSSPVAAASIPPCALAMDAVYEPEDTAFLRAAAARGARTLGGKWWLIYQAAEQLRLWTGQEPPIKVMAEAFDRAGASRAACDSPKSSGCDQPA